MINKDKFAYRQVLAQDNIILSKYSSTTTQPVASNQGSPTKTGTAMKHFQEEVYSPSAYHNLDDDSESQGSKNDDHDQAQSQHQEYRSLMTKKGPITRISQNVMGQKLEISKIKSDPPPIQSLSSRNKDVKRPSMIKVTSGSQYDAQNSPLITSSGRKVLNQKSIMPKSHFNLLRPIEMEQVSSISGAESISFRNNPQEEFKLDQTINGDSHQPNYNNPKNNSPFSKLRRGSRVAKPSVIDLDQPMMKRMDSIQSDQQNFLNSQQNEQHKDFELRGSPLQKHQTFIQSTPHDQSESQSEFNSSSKSSSSFSEDSDDSDMISPQKRKTHRQRRRNNEVETAKQFILSSAMSDLGGAPFVKTRTFRTAKPGNFFSDEDDSDDSDDSNNSQGSHQEEDSFKSEIGSQEQEQLDAQDTKNNNNQVSIQPMDYKQRETLRKQAQLKRQKIKIQKKGKNSKDKKTMKKKTNFFRKKEILKRSRTLFNGLENPNEIDEDYDNNLNIENQKLRDVYKVNKLILFPDDAIRMRWEILVTLLLLFTAIMTPWRLAFVLTNDDVGWTVIDIFTDSTFAIDIVLNFFSAYQQEDNDEVIFDRKVIAKAYIKSWFFIDILSVMPFTYFLDTNDYASLARIARLPKLYRLIRMAKLTRILKIIKERNTISKYLNEVLKISVGMERLTFYLFMMFLLVHITACFWVIIPQFEDSPEVWIVRQNYQNYPDERLYLSAFYYVIVIVTTIGYGDITVRTPIEQLFCIILLVIGAVSFSFAIGSLSSVLSSMDAKAAKLKEKLQILNDIQGEYKIPYDLYRRLRFNLRYDHSKDTSESNNFLNELPQNLKVELSVLMHQDLIKSIKFFRKRSPHFLAFVGPMLKPVKVEKGQYIYKEGDPIDDIYFLENGQAGYALEQYDNAVYLIIDKGYYFGEIDFIYLDQNGVNDNRRKFAALAIEDCDLRVLSKRDLLLADQEFEDIVSDDLFTNAMKRLKRTMKIKKESVKFYEKNTSQNYLGVFQARLSQAPMTTSDFTVRDLSSKSNSLKKEGTLFGISHMQQVDDGDLDDQYGSSSDENKDNSKKNELNAEESRKMKARVSNILQKEGSMRINSGSGSIFQNLIERKKNKSMSSFEMHVESLEGNNQNNEEPFFGEEEEKVKSNSFKKENLSISDLNESQKSQGDDSKPKHSYKKQSSFLVKTNPEKKFNTKAQNVSPMAVSQSEALATEENEELQGGLRWNILKQALNKKIQNIKTNQFTVFPHKESTSSVAGTPQITQHKQAPTPTVKITNELTKVEQGNKEMFHQMHDRMDNLEKNLDKINDMMTSLMNSQLKQSQTVPINAPNNADKNTSSTSNKRSNQFLNANVNYSGTTFAGQISGKFGGGGSPTGVFGGSSGSPDQQGEQLKETIKKMLRDNYLNNFLLNNQN